MPTLVFSRNANLPAAQYENGARSLSPLQQSIDKSNFISHDPYVDLQMGHMISRELKRDMIHLRDHEDFKRALGATGELLEAYAKAEQLRVKRKEQKMKERRHSRQLEQANPRMTTDPYEEHDARGKHFNRRTAKAKRPRDCMLAC